MGEFCRYTGTHFSILGALFVIFFCWWPGYYRSMLFRTDAPCTILPLDQPLAHYQSCDCVDVLIPSLGTGNYSAKTRLTAGPFSGIDINTVIAGGNVTCLLNSCYYGLVVDGCTADLMGEMYAPIVIGNVYNWQLILILWGFAKFMLVCGLSCRWYGGACDRLERLRRTPRAETNV